jgi:hypothetical protein
MTEPSAPAIAYAAIQVCHYPIYILILIYRLVQLIVSLSSAEQWTSQVTGLDLYELYLSIVESLKQINHPWVKETLDYWTKFVRFCLLLTFVFSYIERVAPRLTQTSRRRNGRHTAAASDDSDSDDMDGFLDDPPPSEQQRRPSPPPSEQQRRPSPPPSEQQRRPSPPPSEQQRHPTPRHSRHADEDDDDRLTPPPSTPTPLTPPPVAKSKAPAKRGKATRRKR